MSDPMSSVEIEDVLSSIRRLVSEDLRPAHRPVVGAPPARREGGADKLILTPALRVVPDPVPVRAEPPVEDVADVGAPMVEMGDWPPADWPEAEAEVLALNAADAAPGWAQEDPGEMVAEPQVPDAELVPDEAWVDQAEAEVIADLDRAEAEPEDAAAKFAEAVAIPTDLQFDETILRDLVRDMIREELQGGLGERITRNVRKLVRQEIARALAARDLE